MFDDLDGSARIAWTADGFDGIRVYGRWRTRDELESFARGVADAALLNRTLPDLRTALRSTFGGTFDLDVRRRRDGAEVVVSLHPPPGTPNPDV